MGDALILLYKEEKCRVYRLNISVQIPAGTFSC